jgi:cytochrome oxidase Cu insertion factor (SCO1/SenC/PrrC family)
MKFKITEKGINFLLIFILGFLVGVALKSEAQKRVTIGFNDYLAPKYKQDIDLLAPAEEQNQIQEKNPDQQNQPDAPPAQNGD